MAAAVQAPTSSLPSGVESKADSEKKRKPTKLELAQQKITELEQTLKSRSAEVSSLTDRLKSYEKTTGLSERSATKLRVLEYFHSRVANASLQLHCDEDKKYMRELIDDVSPIMKSEFEKIGISAPKK